VLDELVRSGIAVANGELRSEPFHDAGWPGENYNNRALLVEGERPVSNLGGFRRFSILGFAVGQVSYARPHATVISAPPCLGVRLAATVRGVNSCTRASHDVGRKPSETHHCTW
jgi:hypothetical protein